MDNLKQKKPLTRRESLLVKLVVETAYGLTKQEYADRLGCSLTHLYRLLGHPRVTERVNKEWDRLTYPLRLLAYDTLEKALRDGSVAAARTVLKLTGDLVERSEVKFKGGRAEPGSYDPEAYKKLKKDIERIKRGKVTSEEVAGEVEPGGFDPTRFLDTLATSAEHERRSEAAHVEMEAVEPSDFEDTP